MTATGPAWQVRESARQTLLTEIMNEVFVLEEQLAQAVQPEGWGLRPVTRQEVQRLLHKKFLRLLDGQEPEKNDHTLLVMGGWTRDQTKLYKDFVAGTREKIKSFERSPEEGQAIYATLFEWTVKEIAHPYHSALERQAAENPQLIYHAESAMDKVPLE
jgi:hypothetical protein